MLTSMKDNMVNRHSVSLMFKDGKVGPQSKLKFKIRNKENDFKN